MRGCGGNLGRVSSKPEIPAMLERARFRESEGPRVAREALELITAKVCPVGTATLCTPS